jgi:23S rRNA pseudouridine1911/1915/1917 synthase
MKTHDVRRVYYAVALGNIKDESGRIDLPIGRHPVDRKKMAVIRDPSARSREAITNFEVLERFRGFTFVKCKLETGRTHQIRVHLSAKGHPLLGDVVYGGADTAFEKHNRELIDGQCLHAGELSFEHPRTHEMMTFYADMPENMREIIEKLRRIANS